MRDREANFRGSDEWGLGMGAVVAGAEGNSSWANATSLAAEERAWRREAYSVIVPLIASLCLVALLANLAVVAAVPWRKGHLTPTLRMTVSLALADTWTSLWVLGSLVYNSYLYFVLDISTSACVALVVENVRTGGMLTGVVHLLALALNHYLSIARPFVYRKLLTPPTTSAVLGLAWTLPPAALMAFSASKAGQAFRTPSTDCLPLDFLHQTAFRASITGLLSALFLLTCLLYLHILVILRSMRMNSTVGASGVERERRMMVTTLLILATFFVGWAPATLHYVASAVGGLLRRHFSQRSLMAFSAAQLSAIMLKSILNPIIYAVRIPEIKERLAELSGRGGGRREKRYSTALSSVHTARTLQTDNGHPRLDPNSHQLLLERTPLTQPPNDVPDPVRV